VRGRDLVVPLAVWAVSGLLVGALLVAGAASSKRGVRERQELRSQLGAVFLATQARDVVAREQGLAQQYLSVERVDAASFGRAVEALGVPAAVLVDAQGRLLQVAPAEPQRLGADMTSYPHIRRALLTGEPSVSPVVLSAARGVPVVGFAVPFQTRSGRRVFSGAWEVQSSPLGQYLRTAVSLPGARSFLVDESGKLVAAGDTDSLTTGTLDAVAPGVWDLVAAGATSARVDGEPARLHAAAVRGTPWTLVVVTPDRILYAAGARSERIIWPAFAVSGLLGLVAAVLVGRARRSRRALAVADARFRSVFDSSLLGMLLTAPDGRLLAVNDAFCDLVGYTAHELRTIAWGQITHPDDRDLTDRNLQPLLDGRATGCGFELRYLRQDGKTVHAILTSTLIRDADGTPLYFATQVLDVTTSRELEQARQDAATALLVHSEELQAANAQLAKAHQAVSDLVAMLSHDLRTPLATIFGFAELAIDTWNETGNDEKRHYLDLIKSSSQRATMLLEETLTFSALDSGALTPSPADVQVDQAVSTILSTLEGTLPPVGLHGLTPARVWIDPGHLAQVLTNLLTNAAKYGKPPITISCDQLDADTVAVHVTDAGPGVPADFVPHLFERFTRADAARRGHKRGTGFGLYIVKSLLHANNADITYEPAPGGGSCFTLLVPATATSPAPPHAPALAGEPSTPR
jgi:PAS domain S-box-containing protein